MSSRAQVNRKYWNDSKQIFFTPKLSLQGHNLFPQINQVHAYQAIRQQPFLNILKKPIMSIYDRMQLRSEKKPVCIVGTTKEVECRHVKTGYSKKERHDSNQTNVKKETLSTCSPYLLKSEAEILTSASKQILPISQPIPEGTHFYILGPGNNRSIVQEVLQQRDGWVPTTSSIFHLRWEQARPKFQNLNAPHRQLINHLPGHEVISDKANLHLSLKEYCQKHQEYLYRLMPVSYIFDFQKEDVQDQMKKFVNFYVDCNLKNDPNPEKWQIQNTKGSNSLLELPQSPKKIPSKQVKVSSSLKPKSKSQLPSPGSDILRRRQQIKNAYKALISQLKPYYTFQDMSSPKKNNPYVTAEPEDIYGDRSLWLLKPSDLNRGRGIKLFHTVQELGQMLKSELAKNQKGSFIVQKYLQKPMLLKNRKFDIRVWALMTHTRQLYFFQEGYIRLSSESFTLDSSSLFTHLTNNAVQKHATNYGQFQEGNILPLSYLYQQEVIQKEQLYNQIKKNILLSMRAAGNKLFTPSLKHKSISVGNTSAKQAPSKMKYFQIFGYDFMVDHKKHLWLIEVNTNPCIELSNQWLASIVPRMLDDAFKLTLDRLFPKKNKIDRKTFKVEGYQDEVNMWESLELSDYQNVVTVL